MTDSMKFGPEWLRNLSHENSNNSSGNSGTSSCSTSTSSTTTTTATPMPRFQLAEHRYGREEMLALFDNSVVAPDSLKQINALYIEKTQTPLLLLQWTEEELRTWNRGINSDVGVRVPGKGGQGPGSSSIGGPGSMRGSLGGRGGSMDRGRGRGRGFHYNRGLSYDESDGNSGPPSSYSRSIRSYERDRMQGDRSSSWSERNGDLESSSPRKEFGNSNREMSWRRNPDEDSWRTTRHDKWVRGGGGGGAGGNSGGTSNNSNWRDDWDREPNHRSDNSRNRLWDEPNHNRHWDSEDNLPEWATEKPSESGGSFDASGAFHGTNSDDDEENVNSRVSKQKNHEDDVHKPDISSNNRVSSSNQESNVTERERLKNGPVSHTDRIDFSTKKSKEKHPQDHQTGGGPPPLRQSHSTSSISNSIPPTRKSSAPLQQAQENTNSHAHPLTTSTSLSGMPVTKKLKSPDPKKTGLLSQTGVETQVQKEQTPPPQPQPTQQQMRSQSQPNSNPVHFLPNSVLPPANMRTPVNSLSSIKTEDTGEPEGMKLMQEVVAKLVDVDDSTHHSKPVPHGVSQALDNSDQWFYTDPQGEVQGPFSSTEMGEWYKSGYFCRDLMVRRADEQSFYPLGDLEAKYGKIPFIDEPSTAPTGPVLPALPEPAPVPVPPAARPSSVEEALLIHQRLQFQNFVLRQQQQALVAKAMAQPEHWNSLSPEQQMLMRASLEQNAFQQMPQIPPSVPAPAPIPTTTDNAVGALFLQKLQQAQAQAQAQQQQQLQQQQQQLQQNQHQHPNPLHQHPPQMQQQLPEQPQQLVGGDPVMAGATPRTLSQPMPPKTVENEPRNFESVVSFLSQLKQNMAMKQVDSVWSGPNPAAANTAQQPLPLPSWANMPPLWGDVQPKMKTEQEILEEQRAEEARKKEELRKQTELNLKLKEIKLKEELAAAEEERKKRKKAEEEEAERKQKEEEAADRKRKKEEEEAKRKEQAAAKKAELERKKEEEKRRKEEEKKQKEEEKKKQEEERRKLEEDKKKHEEERKRKEEENRRTEQARKQTEALKRLQEQAKVSPPWAPPPPPATSLSEILKTERKHQQLLREQQQLQQQQQLQFEAQVRNQPSNKMQLKWAAQKLPTKVKSLAEIQAEEQENLIAKQVEKEKERSTAGITTPAGSIWSGQNLSWNNNSNSVSVWGNNTAATVSSSGGGSGFWEDVTPATKNQSKPNIKSAPTVQPAKASVGKTKTKKEEAVVMKLFEQTKPRSDEFFLWCTKALSSMQSHIDVPTFVTFLRDIESEYEVKEYVKLYLGDRKVATDFAAQFIERRMKMTRPSGVDNNTSVPAQTATNHFQEVKGKNKKPKKSKMLRVDNKILGFNVTAAQDRINVGDRDYGDGI